MPGVGVGIYETDSTQTQTPPLTPPRSLVAPAAAAKAPQYSTDSSESYQQTGRSGGDHTPFEQNPNLKHEPSDESNYLPSAPYQEMLQHSGKDDPTVELARTQMASHQYRTQAERLYPNPKAGLPQEPTAQAIEPTIPASRLGRRCLTHKPKRTPDLVQGKMVQDVVVQADNMNVTHVHCVGCGVTLQIAKNTVVVNCPKCDQVHLSASCRIRNGHWGRGNCWKEREDGDPEKSSAETLISFERAEQLVKAFATRYFRKTT
jgi:predicted RNA-binding Zn-ribbon protein involved in translation (DUF1610 family)